MRAWMAGVALVCLADAGTRRASSLRAPSRPMVPRVARPTLAPPTLAPTEAPPAPLPALMPSRVRLHDATIRPGAGLRVRHEGSPYPARAALRVGRETWVATPAGVLRFDERLWRDPAHARPMGGVDALPSPDVRALAVSPDGVWVGTARGLRVVGPRAVTHLAGHVVTALAPPFVGTARGLFCLDAPVRGADSLHVTALLRCGDTLLVGTHDRGLWTSAGGAPLAPVPGLPTARVDALAGCDDPWVATLRGVFRLRAGVVRPVDGAHAHATAIAPVGERVYVGTFGDGVALVDGGRAAAVTFAGRVSSLTRDPASGALLVATDRSLDVVRPASSARVRLDDGPRGRVVALVAHAGSLWAGTLAHGLYRRARGAWRTVDGFDARVSALAAGPDGRLWVGTAGGLGRLAIDGARVEPFRDPRGWFARHVNALQPEGDTLWVFAHPGAVGVSFAGGAPTGFRYLGSTDATERVTPGVPFTKELGALRRATLFARSGAWLASAEGLLRDDGGDLRALTELGGALDDRMIYDVEARGDEAWALGWRAGLLRWAGGTADVWPARWLATPQGLVPFRGGWLVATADRGLVRVSRDRGGLRFTAWGAAQGLAGDAVDAVAVTDEGVWVGEAEGVDRLLDGGRALATRGGHGR